MCYLRTQQGTRREGALKLSSMVRWDSRVSTLPSEGPFACSVGPFTARALDSGYVVFSEPPGSYSICEVCNWEDDNIQIRHPRRRGGANSGSIFDYQQSCKQWQPNPSLKRDPGRRLLEESEAQLPSGDVGAVDYDLDYYGERPAYHWRKDDENLP